MPFHSEITPPGKRVLGGCTGAPGKPSIVEIVWKSPFSDAAKQELSLVSTVEGCLGFGFFLRKKSFHSLPAISMEI